MRTSKATLALALILTVAVFAPSATSAKPIKDPAPLPESFVDPTCGFPILIEVLDQNEFVKIFEKRALRARKPPVGGERPSCPERA